MAGKQMEGDDRYRRKKAREAQKKGKSASEGGSTLGASKQRQHVVRDEEHAEKLASIREGKQPSVAKKGPHESPPRDGVRG